jgi:hypothetical protein
MPPMNQRLARAWVPAPIERRARRKGAPATYRGSGLVPAPSAAKRSTGESTPPARLRSGAKGRPRQVGAIRGLKIEDSACRWPRWVGGSLPRPRESAPRTMTLSRQPAPGKSAPTHGRGELGENRWRPRRHRHEKFSRTTYSAEAVPSAPATYRRDLAQGSRTVA